MVYRNNQTCHTYFDSNYQSFFQYLFNNDDLYYTNLVELPFEFAQMSQTSFVSNLSNRLWIQSVIEFAFTLSGYTRNYISIPDINHIFISLILKLMLLLIITQTYIWIYNPLNIDEIEPVKPIQAVSSNVNRRAIKNNTITKAETYF